MNSISLGTGNLRRHGASSFITITLLALGTATILLSLLFRHHLSAQTVREAGIVDQVVGTAAYPMELILGSLMHLSPPGALTPLEELNFLRTHHHVALSAPVLALDRIQDTRVVASTRELFDLYAADVGAGRMFAAPFEAVIGANAAAELDTRPGGVLVIEHGLHLENPEPSVPRQHEQTLRAVGILAPTGTMLDELVIISLETSRLLHQPTDSARPNRGSKLGMDLDFGAGNARDGVHALLLRFTSPAGAPAVEPLIAARPGLVSAKPREELSRLGRMFDQGLEIMGVSAIILVILAVLSLLAALYGGLDQRQFDLALMRTLGASRLRVSLTIMLDGLLLGILGAAFGLAIAHGGAELGGYLLDAGQRVRLTGALWLPGEGAVLAAIIAAGVLSALVPAIKAYRLDIASVLSRRF
ncbi:MAG: ABC transporter permease [Gammaproteobacteria bacterium]